jgi:hypothetical protein
VYLLLSLDSNLHIRLASLVDNLVCYQLHITLNLLVLEAADAWTQSVTTNGGLVNNASHIDFNLSKNGRELGFR